MIHLAALSNDPLGDLDPNITYDVNYHATVRLAECAKAAGVARFVFSSSCSLYGAAGDEALGERSGFNPQTPYGESKILAEQALAKLGDRPSRRSTCATPRSTAPRPACAPISW